MTDRTKVALARCDRYGAGVQDAMEQVLSPLGGLGAFVNPGQTVLIKPNLLTAREPEKAVTTHPEVVRALIRLLKKQQAKPLVADSPSNVTRLEELWVKTGFRALCDEEEVPLLNLEKEGSVAFTMDGFSFSVAQPILKADVVINMPKVKTHVLTIFTGAVKNMYGVVPGFQKTSLHKLHPTPPQFGDLMAAIYSKAKPHLSIADGIVGMEGDGPSGGDPVKLGLLAASVDAVALDRVLCEILKIDFRTVPYLRPLQDMNLGETRLERIDVMGASIEELAPRSFRVPGTARGRMIPRWLVGVLGPWLWIRPHFTDRCVSCGLCIKSCPVRAITLAKGQRPLLDPAKCIGCCCCHEVCPAKAIVMTQSPFLNFVRRGRLP
jgi:uncharacterized protein (DUF362 family)/Pyruvate/2-oxoacid:ferredoxin oxidoreductase delta subunit